MSTELQPREKTAVPAEGEPTKAGPTFIPSVDIYESEEGLTLLADMPGVDEKSVNIDLHQGTLTILGGVTRATEGERKYLYREYEEGDYFRQFTLSDVIDQNKISAKVKEGVLTLVLPKVEPAKPRQIKVTAS